MKTSLDKIEFSDGRFSTRELLKRPKEFLLGLLLAQKAQTDALDVPLGHAFNQVQLGMFLMLMAKITGNAPGFVYHKVVNAHIYEDQLEMLKTVQLVRKPRDLPRLGIHPVIETLQDVTNWVTTAHFWLEGYDPHPAIKFPFSV